MAAIFVGAVFGIKELESHSKHELWRALVLLFVLLFALYSYYKLFRYLASLGKGKKR